MIRGVSIKPGIVAIALAAVGLIPWLLVGCGYGNPFGGSAQMDDDSAATSCDDVECGSHASCAEGECVCDDGYDGDPDVGCEPESDDDTGSDDDSAGS